jgi:hypothetical protein
VVYSTYVGGSERDQGLSVCVDSAGTAYITGSTNSSDFPRRSPLYDTKDGSEDCFITAILGDGSDLAFSSYIGGYGTDIGECIDIDAGGNVTIAGTTWSQDFQRDSDQTIIQPNGFIFRTNLTHVLSSTFFGGSDSDQIRSMVVGSQNNIAVCGITRSDDIPYNGTLTYAGGYDAFVYAIRPIDIAIDPNTNGGLGDSWLSIFLRTEVFIPTMASSVIVIGALFLTLRIMRRRKYEVAMGSTGGPVAGLLWNHPTDHPDSTPSPPTPEPQWNHPTDHPDGLVPEQPEPQWNHPTDHPDGGLDPGTSEPQWNHPTDHPDGAPGPSTPEPQWNHPTDHPDGGLDPDQPQPQWDYPTDHPDWIPKLQPKDMLLELPASHPAGCVCPLCAPDEYLEPTPKDIAEKKLKRSKKSSSDVELD